MTPSFPVAARAVRSAYIVASVPELAKRTISRPNRRQIISAPSRVIGEGVAKRVPTSRVAWASFTTSSLRCPTRRAPKPMERSSISRPSTSLSHAPLAATMEMGYGSQCWKLDATPRGVTFDARRFSAPDSGACFVNFARSFSKSSWMRDSEIGLERFGVDLKVC